MHISVHVVVVNAHLISNHHSIVQPNLSLPTPSICISLSLSSDLHPSLAHHIASNNLITSPPPSPSQSSTAPDTSSTPPHYDTIRRIPHQHTAPSSPTTRTPQNPLPHLPRICRDDLTFQNCLLASFPPTLFKIFAPPGCSSTNPCIS